MKIRVKDLLDNWIFERIFAISVTRSSLQRQPQGKPFEHSTSKIGSCSQRDTIVNTGNENINNTAYTAMPYSLGLQVWKHVISGSEKGNIGERSVFHPRITGCFFAQLYLKIGGDISRLCEAESESKD